eukprot:scaffold149_cov315-Pinguiococcus_pyrenoidosus.AAC.40
MQGAPFEGGWKGTLEHSTTVIERYTDLLGDLSSRSPEDPARLRDSSDAPGGWWDVISAGSVLHAVGSWLDGPEASKWAKLIRGSIDQGNGEMHVLKDAMTQNAQLVEEKLASTIEQSVLWECGSSCSEEAIAEELALLLTLQELRYSRPPRICRQSEIA